MIKSKLLLSQIFLGCKYSKNFELIIHLSNFLRSKLAIQKFSNSCGFGLNVSLTLFLDFLHNFDVHWRFFIIFEILCCKFLWSVQMFIGEAFLQKFLGNCVHLINGSNCWHPNPLFSPM